MSKDKTDNQYLKEIAHFSRKTSDNVQFFFWVFVIGGALTVMYNVMHTVNQVL